MPGTCFQTETAADAGSTRAATCWTVSFAGATTLLQPVTSRTVVAGPTPTGGFDVRRQAPARFDGERWVAAAGLGADEVAVIERGGVVDRWGEINGERYEVRG